MTSILKVDNIRDSSDNQAISISNGVVTFSNDVIPTDNVSDLGTSSSRYKDLFLSGGAYIGGTGSANYLDDYEEGTWTPTLPNGGTISSTAGSVYTKVGNLVTFQMYMNMSGIPNNSTAFHVGNLPFLPTYSGGKQLHGNAVITYINGIDGSTYGSGLPSASNYIYWHNKVNGGILANSAFTSTTQLILTGFYYTS